MFEIPASLLGWFYSLTHNYVLAIALIAAFVMAITTPLTLKSTRGMLDMQRLAPEMRRLQHEYRDDRVKLNEEMMKLYQQNKVNPMASCLPILAQMPVFIVMFYILRGLVYRPVGAAEPIARAVVQQLTNGPVPNDLGFIPRYLSTDSELFQSLQGKTEMNALGLDLSLSPFRAIQDGVSTGWIYALLVVALGGMYFVQQRMVAARASISPTMSPTQQKLMQYLPVAFAVFQIFFLAALVVYYIFQTIIRIGQQGYITRKFYGGEDSLGRQAQRAGEEAREQAKKQKAERAKDGGGGKQSLSERISEAREGAADARSGKNGQKSGRPAGGGRPQGGNKRVTPKSGSPNSGNGSKSNGSGAKKTSNRPSANGKPGGAPRPSSSGKSGSGGSKRPRSQRKP